MKPVVLFDFGDTLVGYCTKDGFTPYLRAGIAAAESVLRAAGVAVPAGDGIAARAAAENREASNYRVRPIEARLGRVFGFDPRRLPREILDAACRAFVAPLIGSAEPYPDARPALEALRGRSCRLGLVSNMPWGSIVAPWQEELDHHGLSPYFEHTVFCRDVGWRKPARPPFDAILRRFGCAPSDAVYIGDRPDWDFQGARRAGLDAILVDRRGEHPRFPGPRVRSLAELPL